MTELLAEILAVVHGLAAGAVTVHVLLSHREVRSAIGWIGLAWLSPLVGFSIYLAFGINRTGRRASAMDVGLAGEGTADDSAALGATHPKNIVTLSRFGGALTGLPLTLGNALTPLRNGTNAYPAMIAAIDGAEHSVALASYIFRNDSAGGMFIDALIRAKQRGVAVRVLVDGIGSGYFFHPAVRRLREAGISAELFLHEWLPWKMTFINLRNHKKLLVVDGTVGFTGGMNISDANVAGDKPIEVRDVQAQLEGPIVRHLMLTFARDWEFTTGEALEDAVWWPEHAEVGPVAMRGITSGPDESVGRIEAVWSTAIEEAEERVRILTPYFLPEDRLLEVLRRAALRGVRIELIVPEHTNHFYVNWAVRAHLEAVPLEMIDCYLTPEPFDHSKLMTVDGHWAALGSANWDARSMRLNFEFLVECYDQGATEAIDALIDRKLIGAVQLTRGALERRSVFGKLCDASARLFLPYL